MLLPIWEPSPSRPRGAGDRFFTFSPKLRREVSFSSKLEFERWLLLEFDPCVTAFCEQPAEVEVWFEGRWCVSRLDFWVRTAGGEEFYEEVKYSSELRKPTSRAQRQIKIQKAALSAGGKSHRVLTETEICRNITLLNSVRTLLGEFDIHYLSRLEGARGTASAIIEWVSQNPASIIDDVLQTRPKGVTAEAFRLMLLELIRTHQIDARLEIRNLSPTSQLFARHDRSGGASL